MRFSRLCASIAPHLLLCFLAFPAVTLFASAQMPQSGVPVVRIIDTPAVTLRLSRLSGDLVGLRWKDPSLELISEPRLGENFRILIPRPGYEADYFYSRDQKVSRIELEPDGVVCVYNSLRNSGEAVPVQVRYRIRVEGGRVLFSIQVDNPTDRKLAEVMYGMIGGQKGIGSRLDTESMVPGANSNAGAKLFTRFGGGGYGGGNLGIRYDAGSFTYPGRMSMGWMDVWNPKLGVGYYYADQDPDTRLSMMEVELRPFSKSASVEDVWPSDAEAHGEPVGLTMGWVDMPYAGKGTFKAGPVALEAHTGDWHTASGIYRSWFDQHFNIERPKSWLRQENAWQSIILSNSEDVVVHRFDELPKLAADAKKYGITTFEILGWDIGGIDRGYPQYTPDPRLGTPAEFKKALADMRAIGVHPLIFSNIQVADTATPIFRDRLKRYTVDGPWAPDWRMNGWGEGTISARAGFTNSNMTTVSPAHPAFREYLMSQYLQLVRDGAEGFQFDKGGGIVNLDFNPTVPLPPTNLSSMGFWRPTGKCFVRARPSTPTLPSQPRCCTTAPSPILTSPTCAWAGSI